MKPNNFIGQVKEFNRYAAGTTREDRTLDLIDKKILYLLSENARFSYTYIAKRLKIKRETVAYRIKRIMEKNFLHGYLTLLNERRLGFRNYLMYLKLKTLTNEKELINYLMGFKEVTRLKNCSGTYDLQIVVSVKEEEELAALFEKITSRYHLIIQNYDFLTILEEDFLGLNLILDEKEIKTLMVLEHKGSAFQKEFEKASGAGEEANPDDTDKLILEELKLDGSMSIRELSRRVKLAPLAVENRIRKLIRSGIIKRFMPLAALNQLGYQWWKVFFNFKNLNRNQFFTFLKYHPNILWYMKLLGRWDYQLSVFAPDNAAFHQILDEIRTEFADNIINYDSIIVFNQFKYVQRVK